MTKAICLDRATEITKEYARGGGVVDLPKVLEGIYKKLVELSKDAGETGARATFH